MRKNICYLYGFKSENLEFIREKLEEVLHITFNYHEGLHRGEYYLWRGTSYSQEIILDRNFDIEEQTIRDERYPEIKLFCSLAFLPQADKIHQKLISQIPEIILLEREEFDTEEQV